MPKNEIDYSNTIIYKITCNDPNITDVYVGHTTNFVQRKHAHKSSCTNDKLSNYKCKLYETIRCNGGWPNWKMTIINFFDCADHYEARKKEQEYFILLNANLNSIEPLPKPKNKSNSVLDKNEQMTTYCETCNLYFKNSYLEFHNNTQKHLKKLTKKSTFVPKQECKYFCEKCDYGTCKKSSYDSHLLSARHQKTTQDNEILPKSKVYICSKCNKEYKSRVGLWKHNKICDKNNISNTDLDTGKTDLYEEDLEPSSKDIIQMMKMQMIENQEIRNLIIEFLKKETTSHST